MWQSHPSNAAISVPLQSSALLPLHSSRCTHIAWPGDTCLEQIFLPFPLAHTSENLSISHWCQWGLCESPEGFVLLEPQLTPVDFWGMISFSFLKHWVVKSWPPVSSTCHRELQPQPACAAVRGLSVPSPPCVASRMQQPVSISFTG